MSNGDAAQLSSCGCCEAMPTLNAVANRPGLPALSYRIGTYGLFYQRMLDEIHAVTLSDDPSPAHPLQGLLTRAPDDPAVALLDAWAVVADVLTFYQERIANEGYLRTAVERRSVLELARAIGYELSPGVAASAYLQFTVEAIIGTAASAGIARTQGAAGPGSSPFNSGVVSVPQGTQVQSVPAPGQLPQTFETSADFEARVDWNALTPRLSRTQDVALYDNNVFLLGTSTDFASGIRWIAGRAIVPDRVAELPTAQVYLLNPLTRLDASAPSVRAVRINQVVLQGTKTGLQTGDRLLLVGTTLGNATQPLAFIVRNVETDANLGTTTVEFVDNPRLPSFAPASAPSNSLKLPGITFNQPNVQEYILTQSITEGDLQAFLQMNNWDAAALANLVNNPPPPPPSPSGAFSFAATAAFFGYNAPLWGSLPNPNPNPTPPPTPPLPLPFRNGSLYANSWDPPTGPTGNIWTNSQGAANVDADVFLERSFPQILPQSWTLFESPGLASTAYVIQGVVEESLADYSLSGKSTGLVFDQSVAGKPPFPVRKTKAFIQSQQLALADVPVVDDVRVGTNQLMLNEMVVGLTPGQPVALNGMRADAPGVTANEILIIQDVVHVLGFTQLTFVSGLRCSYLRSSVTLSANVVLGTHGATVQEVLGSGDGSQANQTFVLKQPPLTYVSAPTPSGIASTLQVRVNGLAWQEAPTLYGLSASDKEYEVRLADDGTVSVTFGDPAARLKTGPHNVSATYRTGIGLVGNVTAGSLAMLQSRQPGLRGVTNPLPATGAADPQNLADARTNAPLTVLTLDRIVSLDDYQAFVQAFPGVGKAQAITVWSGDKRLVHITIAAADGETIDSTWPLYQTLVQAIEQAHDPVQNFAVAGYQPLTFNLKAGLLIDQPTYDPTVVTAAVAAALAGAFSFANRAFAQAVTAAEIVTLMQAVAGVSAVYLTQLYQTGDPNGPAQTEPSSFLTAWPARWQGGAIQPAQLLLLNPLGVTLTEVTS